MDKKLKTAAQKISDIAKTENAVITKPINKKITQIFPKPQKIDVTKLPFFGDDCTIGVENELQAVVMGKSEDVDICSQLFESSFYSNLSKRSETNEFQTDLMEKINLLYKDKNSSTVFENSFVRFPIKSLTKFAKSIFYADLRYDQNKPDSRLRSDHKNFFITKNKETYIRIPISYLLKLSVADAISINPNIDPGIKLTGEKLMRSFLNDNTSPELTSFYVTKMKTGKNAGKSFVRETLLRFFMSQILLDYANKKFEIEENGQKAMLFFASHTPARQKRLNDLIPDNLYRELFMSPCLSGWRFGEKKYRYMSLCHEVLSRSQLNAVKKLKDAQIIQTNLIALPNTSNTCLANNGTHINTGSIKLEKNDNFKTEYLNNHKYVGDLVTKIFEHFIPLFINTYSAAPYRMDFMDFHPERALGFLPHQLDYTHLRMLWRNWKKKAKNSIFSHDLTPFGPTWLDSFLKKSLGLKGDFIPDMRLIDYFVSVMSTETTPALDGRSGNQSKLLEDLSSSGIFHSKMSLYLLFRTRFKDNAGFSGFEGRYYSTFENFNEDMRYSGLLQALITTLAYKYIVQQKITHSDIPDTIFVESERRQAVFTTAAGVKYFYVKNNTQNRFLKKILSKIEKIKSSTRYRGFYKVEVKDYKKALIKIIERDASDIISESGFSFLIKDLNSRISFPRLNSTMGKLTSDMVSSFKSKSPTKIDPELFNENAETYYRDVLRKKHMKEAFLQVEEDFYKLDLWASFRDESYKKAVFSITKGEPVSEFLLRRKTSILNNNLSGDELSKLIQLMIILIGQDLGKKKART